MKEGLVASALAVLVAGVLAVLALAGPGPDPAGGTGQVVMSTDKPCYGQGEAVDVTATGWAAVSSIGSFPKVFWAVTNESGDAVFWPGNPLTAVGTFNGTLEGTWNQTFLLYQDPRTWTPVPPGKYTIWFYEVPLVPDYPPGWDPADLEIGDCGEELTATLRVMPRTLNVRSSGRWVTARIEFARPVAGDVEPASLHLEGVLASRVWMADGTTAMAKFGRGELIDALPVGTAAQVCVAGRLTDGRAFGACDAIRVLDPGW